MASRVYQVWKGKNIFLLNGRLVFGPDAKSLIVSLLLIIVPVFIFCTFIGRNLIDKVPAGYAVSAVAIGFTIYVLLLLLLTSARDPGFVPRNARPPDEVVVSDFSASVEAGGRDVQSVQKPRTKQVFVNRLPVTVKYCETCMLYRPPRCSHCSVCDNCVERFDHHCPWVGQCIAKHNYRCFFLLISSSAILCIFIFSLSAWYMKLLVEEYRSTWKAVKESPASVVLMAYCFLLLWFVGGLTGFHLYLIGTNQTTYEFFRCRTNNRFNVYDRGCMKNFLEVFCRNTESSRINFHAYVNEEASKPCKGFNQEKEVYNSYEGRREKVEDDHEIGNDLQKISQRRDSKEVGDVRNIEPSAINFHAYLQEEASRPCRGSIQEKEVYNVDEGRREKVEDDHEIDNDLLNISQRRDSKEVGDVRSRGNYWFPQSPSEFCFGFGLEE